MALETHHIDNRMERCVACTKRFADRDRVTPSYVVGELGLDMRQQPEVGLIFFRGMDDARPFFKHVDCDDPTLKDNVLLPSIHYCIRCRMPLKRLDIVHPVFQVTNPQETNPNDPTDKGVSFGERVHFAHADCRDVSLARTGSLIV